jgi:UDP-N-acetylmuramoyl-tripeptide--D-alanyl-D-alanine ligase
MNAVAARRLLTFLAFARWSGARCALPSAVAGRRIPSITHDSRTVERGGLFVAIVSERDDGNKYAADALKKGAAAALVNCSARALVPAHLRNRLLVVADPLEALQRAARRYRKELGLLTIGITGSNGKTTTRAFATEVLASHVATGGTAGNLNNHIGVPLSVLGLNGDEFAAVFEMGANHMGEIAALTDIARPDIAVVTNVGYSHVGLFGSLANTTRAKLEIAQGLPKSRGILLVNGDDARLRTAARGAAPRLVTFGTGPGCSVRAEDVVVSAVDTRFTVAGQKYRLRMPGRHFVYAALPAIVLGTICQMKPAQIAAALKRVQPVSLRGGMKTKRGVRFILDCYNANPSSMQSALRLLQDTTLRSKRVAVLGDMRELGRYTTMLHTQLGRRVAQSDVRGLVAVGEQASVVAAAAIRAGMSKRSVRTAADSAAAAAALRGLSRKGDTVLLKASRALALEKVFEQF